MKILIAEDDKNFGFVLMSELEGAGHEAELTTDGVEAVLKFIDDGCEFVLLDIKMPHLDGINALRIMKRLRPDIPAIIYSGNAGSGEMADSLRAGALRCITKPFELSQITEELGKYEARRGAGR